MEWLGCRGYSDMGSVFCLGAGWQQWRLLDVAGTHLPLSEAVDNHLLWGISDIILLWYCDKSSGMKGFCAFRTIRAMLVGVTYPWQV